MPDEPRPSTTEETLRAIQERLQSASEAAGRVIAEATASAAGAATRARPRPPAAGWEPERAEPGSDTIAQLLDRVRELLPVELQRRLAEALRELLLALRALIDWYLEHLERRRTEPREVRDIPIS